MAGVFDIAVLGATAAGYAAAYHLAAHKRHVVLIETPHKAAESPLGDWAPKGFFQASGLPKDLARESGAAGFDRVVYHNSTLAKTVEHHARGTAGYVLQSKDLLKAFRAACEDVGVTFKSAKAAPAIRLEEDHVRVELSTPLLAQFLVIAHDLPNDAITELALPVQHVPYSPMMVAGLDMPLKSKAAGKELAGSLHVVEMPERTDLGMFFVVGSTLHLRLISASAAAGTRAAELSALLSSVQRAKLVPADLLTSKARGAIWQPPAGVALELEAHVAKRCLLTGTAGGFAESITGQTISPTVRSALLAAEALLAAHKVADPQEALIRFKTTWRNELADYLRPPNTSLQMLLPLLFVNQQIVAKFTRALLYGEAI